MHGECVMIASETQFQWFVTDLSVGQAVAVAVAIAKTDGPQVAGRGEVPAEWVIRHAAQGIQWERVLDRTRRITAKNGGANTGRHLSSSSAVAVSLCEASEGSPAAPARRMSNACIMKMSVRQSLQSV